MQTGSGAGAYTPLSEDRGARLFARRDDRSRSDPRNDQQDRDCAEHEALPRTQAETDDATGSAAEQREVHAQHGEAGERGRGDRQKAERGEAAHRAIDEQLLTDEAQGSRKSGAREAEHQKARRQLGHL
jgi:hypothetical protein